MKHIITLLERKAEKCDLVSTITKNPDAQVRFQGQASAYRDAAAMMQKDIEREKRIEREVSVR